MIKRIWPAFIILALAISCARMPTKVRAQAGPVSLPFAISAAGGRLPTIVLTGPLQTCSIVVYSVGGGATIIPEAASDDAGGSNPTPTWATATQMNSGSISALGTYTANISPTGITAFGGHVSALTSGTVSGVIACGQQVGLLTVFVSNATTAPTPIASVYVVNSPGVNVVNAASASVPVACATAYPCGFPTPLYTTFPVSPATTFPVSGAFPSPIPYATAAGTLLQVQITNTLPTPIPTGTPYPAPQQTVYVANSPGVTIVAPTNAAGAVIVTTPAPAYTGNQLVNCGAAPGCTVTVANPTAFPTPLYTTFPVSPATTFPVSGAFPSPIPYATAAGTLLQVQVSNTLPTPYASPAATFSPYPGAAQVLTGPSTAPAASAGVYVACVTSAGQLCVTTPAPVTQVSASIGPISFATWEPVTIQSSLPAPAATLPVTTPAPCSTATCALVVYQGTSPWNVNTPAPTFTGNQTVTISNTSPIPGTTPIPFPTLGVNVQSTANVLAFQGTSPWTVTLPTTQPVACVSGCAASAVATPFATNSPGLPPSAAPLEVSQNECYVPPGSAPSASPGTTGVNLPMQCTSVGALVVTTPAPVGTVFVSNATTAPFATWVPVAIASSIPLSVSVSTSASPSATWSPYPGALSVVEGPSAAPAASAGAYIAAVNSAGQLSVTTPAPVGTVFVSNATTAPFATWVPVTIASAVTLPVSGTVAVTATATPPGSGYVATTGVSTLSMTLCGGPTGSLGGPAGSVSIVGCAGGGGIEGGVPLAASICSGSTTDVCVQPTASPNGGLVEGLVPVSDCSLNGTTTNCAHFTTFQALEVAAMCVGGTNATLVNTTVATETVLVDLSAGKSIYVCDVTASQIGTVLTYIAFTQSASNSCTSVSTLWAFGTGSATTQSVQQSGNPIFQTASGDALCVLFNGTTSSQNVVSIHYIQE